MNKYKGFAIFHCLSCDSISIYCPDCRNTSCNGSSCDKCHEASSEFNKLPNNELPPKESLSKRGWGWEAYFRASETARKTNKILDYDLIEKEYNKILDEKKSPPVNK